MFKQCEVCANFFPYVGVFSVADCRVLSGGLIQTDLAGLVVGVLCVLISVVEAAAAEWSHVIIGVANIVIDLKVVTPVGILVICVSLSSTAFQL